MRSGSCSTAAAEAFRATSTGPWVFASIRADRRAKRWSVPASHSVASPARGISWAGSTAICISTAKTCSWAPTSSVASASRYRMQEVGFKKYPCCAIAAGPTEIALRLQRENDLRSGSDPLRATEVAAVWLQAHRSRVQDRRESHRRRPVQCPVLRRQCAAARPFKTPAFHGGGGARPPDQGVHLEDHVSAPTLRSLPRGNTAMDMQIVMENGDASTTPVSILRQGFRAIR